MNTGFIAAKPKQRGTTGQPLNLQVPPESEVVPVDQRQQSQSVVVQPSPQDAYQKEVNAHLALGRARATESALGLDLLTVTADIASTLRKVDRRSRRQILELLWMLNDD